MARGRFETVRQTLTGSGFHVKRVSLYVPFFEFGEVFSSVHADRALLHIHERHLRRLLC